METALTPISASLTDSPDTGDLGLSGRSGRQARLVLPDAPVILAIANHPDAPGKIHHDYVPRQYDIVSRGRMPAIVFHHDTVELLYHLPGVPDVF
jgi:hypothetical protein